MQTPDSQTIVIRFFNALDMIIDAKIIRGVQTFTRRYNINRWNFGSLRKYPERDIFQTAWLTYLVRDFMISPRWLLTGEGEIYEYGWNADKVREILMCEKKRLQTLKIEQIDIDSDPTKRRRGRPRKIREPETQLQLDL